MTEIERFYIGPQIDMAAAKPEKSGGGAPVLTVTRAGDTLYTNGVVANDPDTRVPSLTATSGSRPGACSKT